MATTADIIARVRHHLMTGHNDRLNRLGGAMDASQTSCTLQYELKGVVAGSTITVDLEEMYVAEVSGTSGGSTVTVIRGHEGSTPSTHGSGATVRCNPHFSDYRIFRAINASLLGLSGEGAFWVNSDTLDYRSSQSAYEITAPDFLGVHRVRTETPGPAKDWPDFNSTDFYVDTDPDTTAFPSGVALVLRRAGYSGRAVRLSYRASFAPLSGLSDVVESTSHLHVQGHELLALTAAISLLSGRDVKRSFLHHQPEPRRQEEVPPGAAQQAMGSLLNLRKEELNRYLAFLHQRYPVKVF